MNLDIVDQLITSGRSRLPDRNVEVDSFEEKIK
jgi:hypothetical protein